MTPQQTEYTIALELFRRQGLAFVGAGRELLRAAQALGDPGRDDPAAVAVFAELGQQLHALGVQAAGFRQLLVYAIRGRS